MILPWPDKILNPNVKKHWAIKARAVKIHRNIAYTIAKKDKITPGTSIEIVFCPPDHRHRDRDNMLAMCKAYLDGIADAIEVNDRHFDLDKIKKIPPVKGGYVEIIIK